MTNTKADAALGALLSVPPPVLAPERLREVLARDWGLAGDLVPLTSERDLNHRLSASGGDWLVKLTNPAEPEEMTDFQTRAFQHVAAAAPDVPVSRLIPNRHGAVWTALPEGRLRVFSWLPGSPVHAVPRSDRLSGETGALLGRLTRALEDYDHPAAGHILLWDIQNFARLAPLLPAIADADLRTEADAMIDDFATRIAPQLARLPVQICHADFNPHNLLADPARPDHLTGILDFGDMVRTPRICDLAIAAAYQIEPARPLDSLTAFLRGYARHVAVGEGEAGVLYDLIAARMVTTLAITSWRAASQPGNAAYILRNAPSARAGLAAFRALARDRATDTFRRALRSPA